MKLLISSTELHGFKARQSVPLECEVCSDIFYKPKNLVLRGLKGTRSVSVCKKKKCRGRCISDRLKHYAAHPHQNNIKRICVKRELVNITGGKCFVCGYHRSLTSLIFHHVDPLTKSFSIAHGITKKYKMERLINEAKKCILLCSNCHGEFHDGLLTLSPP